MPKLALPTIALAILAALPAGAATPLGPHAADCAAGRPAMLVRIVGLKARIGTLRVQSYGGDPETFLDKGAYLERVEVRPPSAGPVEVCMPVARPGTYAIAVRHRASGNSNSDLEDGGGVSGNPRRSLLDLAFRRKPAAQEISVRVGSSPVVVPVVMNYLQGGAFKPVATAER